MQMANHCEVADRTEEFRMVEQAMDLVLPCLEFVSGNDTVLKSGTSRLQKVGAKAAGFVDHYTCLHVNIYQAAGLEQLWELSADPPVPRLMVAVELQDLAHQASITQVYGLRFEVWFDDIDYPIALRDTHKIGKGLARIGKVEKESLGSSDIKVVVWKRQLLDVSFPVFDGKTRTLRTPAGFGEQVTARVQPDDAA
jgi:hypothetical protein